MVFRERAVMQSRRYKYKWSGLVNFEPQSVSVIPGVLRPLSLELAYWAREYDTMGGIEIRGDQSRGICLDGPSGIEVSSHRFQHLMVLASYSQIESATCGMVSY